MSFLARDRAGLERAVHELERTLLDATAETDRLRTALDSLPVGIVLFDSSGQVTVRNRASTRDGHTDLLVGEAIAVAARRALAGELVSEQLSLFGPPQQQLVIVGRPLPDGGALVSIDDQSDRARLDAVRTDFVANISHELKTPVGALAVLAEALTDADDLALVRQIATRLVDEAHRASNTIDDLLELSRIELAGLQEPTVVRIASVLEAAVARHRLTAESAGVRCEIACSPDVVVYGDERQLVSAVSNLIDNAVKYSERDSTVHLAVTRADGWVSIAVVDSGVGIPARDLDRVFERFYRVDRARSRVTGGTGLGLSIVRHVANNHRGEVTVASHEGEGSTFTLRIPIGEQT